MAQQNNFYDDVSVQTDFTEEMSDRSWFTDEDFEEEEELKEFFVFELIEHGECGSFEQMIHNSPMVESRPTMYNNPFLSESNDKQSEVDSGRDDQSQAVSTSISLNVSFHTPIMVDEEGTNDTRSSTCSDIDISDHESIDRSLWSEASEYISNGNNYYKSCGSSSDTDVSDDESFDDESRRDEPARNESSIANDKDENGNAYPVGFPESIYTSRLIAKKKLPIVEETDDENYLFDLSGGLWVVHSVPVDDLESWAGNDEEEYQLALKLEKEIIRLKRPKEKQWLVDFYAEESIENHLDWRICEHRLSRDI